MTRNANFRKVAVFVAVLALINPERFVPRTGLERVVAGALEVDDDKFADGLLVLRDKNFFHTPLSRPGPDAPLSRLAALPLFLRDQLEAVAHVVFTHGQAVVREGNPPGVDEVVVREDLEIAFRLLLLAPLVRGEHADLQKRNA